MGSSVMRWFKYDAHLVAELTHQQLRLEYWMGKYRVHLDWKSDGQHPEGFYLVWHRRRLRG